MPDESEIKVELQNDSYYDNEKRLVADLLDSIIDLVRL